MVSALTLLSQNISAQEGDAQPDGGVKCEVKLRVEFLKTGEVGRRWTTWALVASACGSY